MLPATFRDTVRAKALELGCCAAGFSAVGPKHDALQRFREMIADGRHGEMRYLETGIREREEPSLLLQGVKTALSVAIPGPAPSTCSDASGTFSAHAAVPDYHRVVRELLLELLDFIRSVAGWPVEGIACVDGAPVLEKALAEAGGLGRTGKNTLLIVPGAGSAIFLGELLLDLDIKPDGPMEWDPCGSCTACLDACPTGAITASGRIDARRCIAYLTIELKRDFTEQESASTGPWLYGCDRCLEACPHNQTGNIQPHPAFTPTHEIRELTPEKILALTGSAFRQLFAGTTIMRLGLRRLKRNAKAVAERTPRK